MDEIVRHLQSTPAQAPIARVHALPMRMGLVNAEHPSPAIGALEQEVVMAKVIEFYVPKNFRKPLKYATALYCGKIIEFGAPSKKSA